MKYVLSLLAIRESTLALNSSKERNENLRIFQDSELLHAIAEFIISILIVS